MKQINLAGGFNSNAYKNGINLSKRVNDGKKQILKNLFKNNEILLILYKSTL